MYNDAPNNPQHYVFINPFVPNAFFLYPLKISGDVFRGSRKGAMGTNGLIQNMNTTVRCSNFPLKGNKKRRKEDSNTFKYFIF